MIFYGCVTCTISPIFITHDIGEAVYLSDVVAVMERGEIVYKTPVELERPRTMKMI